MWCRLGDSSVLPEFVGDRGCAFFGQVADCNEGSVDYRVDISCCLAGQVPERWVIWNFIPSGDELPHHLLAQAACAYRPQINARSFGFPKYVGYSEPPVTSTLLPLSFVASKPPFTSIASLQLN